MIFGTCRSYFIRWQIFENKVRCPDSKKIRRYFHFLLPLAYPIDRLDWSLFHVVILFHHWYPLLEKLEIWAFILPCNFDHFYGAGRGVHHCCPLSHVWKEKFNLPIGQVAGIYIHKATVNASSPKWTLVVFLMNHPTVLFQKKMVKLHI